MRVTNKYAVGSSSLLDRPVFLDAVMANLAWRESPLHCFEIRNDMCYTGFRTLVRAVTNSTTLEHLVIQGISPCATTTDQASYVRLAPVRRRRPGRYGKPSQWCWNRPPQRESRVRVVLVGGGSSLPMAR